MENVFTWFLKDINFQLNFPLKERGRRINTKRTNSRVKNLLVESKMSRIGTLPLRKYISVRKTEQVHT